MKTIFMIGVDTVVHNFQLPIESYPKETINIILALVIEEHRFRDSSYENLFKRFCRSSNKKKGAYTNGRKKS